MACPRRSSSIPHGTETPPSSSSFKKKRPNQRRPTGAHTYRHTYTAGMMIVDEHVKRTAHPAQTTTTTSRTGQWVQLMEHRCEFPLPLPNLLPFRNFAGGWIGGRKNTTHRDAHQMHLCSAIDDATQQTNDDDVKERDFVLTEDINERFIPDGMSWL